MEIKWEILTIGRLFAGATEGRGSQPEVTHEPEKSLEPLNYHKAQTMPTTPKKKINMNSEHNC